MKYIYWNTKNIDTLDRIIAILEQEKPDVFFLSEIDSDFLEDHQSLLMQYGYVFFPNPGCERVSILKKNNLDIVLSLQSKYYTTIYYREDDTYIVSVHLPSLMFQHLDGLKKYIRNFRSNIDVEIGIPTDKRIVVIGDFNVNPFEKPMIVFDGFAANNSINSRNRITHLGDMQYCYYNPTWQLYARTYFPGTKKFNRPSTTSFDILEFHYLDQVVISSLLKNELKEETISIIESAGNYIHSSTKLQIL